MSPVRQLKNSFITYRRKPKPVLGGMFIVLCYLIDKYSCLQGSKDSSVSIVPDLLSKAATDIKTDQWLEENLKLIPDIMNKIHQNSVDEVSIDFKV